MTLGQGDFLALGFDGINEDGAGVLESVLCILLGFPIPAWIALLAYLIGSLILNRTSFRRHVLAVGGGEVASQLMGLPTDCSIFSVYVLSGFLAGMAGVILAAQFRAGRSIEGVG